MTNPKISQIGAVTNNAMTASDGNVILSSLDGIDIVTNPVAGDNPLGGTGSSNVTYSTNQSLEGVIDAVNVTINDGVTITVGSSGFLQFRCGGNFVNNGTIDASGLGYDNNNGNPSTEQNGCSAGGGGASGGSTGASGSAIGINSVGS